MFFNKLKEELKEYLGAKLLKFAKKYTEDICESIKISHKTTEELIAKYKHTKWEELTPFEFATLKSKFDVVEDSSIDKYVSKNTCFMPWHYVGDTLSEAQKKIEKQEKIKDRFSKTHPPIVADINGNTMKFEDFKAISKVKDILQTEKSTVKAVKAIKEVLKDVE